MARHVRGGGSDAIPMPARIVNRMSEQPLRAPYGPASVSYPRRHRPGQRRTGPSGPGELALRVLGHGPLAYVHGESVGRPVPRARAAAGCSAQHNHHEQTGITNRTVV